jgi:hypothetical protein
MEEQQRAQAPAPDSPSKKVAKPSGLSLSSANLAVGERVEVLWEVEMSDGSDEKIWWGAVILADAEGGDEPGACRLEYEAQHGFETEQRRVVIIEGSFLWDAALKEQLPYRKEGCEGPVLPEAEEAEAADGPTIEDGEEGGDDDEDEDEDDGPPPEDSLPKGTAVKARFQGGDRAYAGTIHKARRDGTYDVLYDADHVLEEGVPRDVIEVVEMSSSVRAALASAGSESTIDGSEELFSTFVSALTSGAMFSKLTAEQQAVASEKVRAMRPHFEAELAAFREERGWGATVTAEDIKVILPKIIARSRSAAVA